MNIKRITVSSLSAAVCAAALMPSAAPVFAADASAELQSVTTEYSEPVLNTSSNQNENISRGDLNGDGLVNATDATIVLVEYSSVSTGALPSFSDELTAAADLNNDNSIDSSDASLILSYYSYISTGGVLRIEDMYPRPGSDKLMYRTTTANAFVMYSSSVTAVPTSSTVITTTTVPYEKVTDLKLSRDIMTLDVGESGLAASVTMFPVNATNQEQIWSSSDEEIASVDHNGWVTAYKEGICTLTVRSADSPEIRSQVVLNVTDPNRVKGIRITKDTLDLKVGEGELASTVTFLPTTARTAETWCTSDPNIATVDGSGWVKGISPGNCTITVSCSTDPAIKAEIAVTILADTTAPKPATTVAPTVPATTAAPVTTTTKAPSTTVTTTVATTTVTTTTEVYLAEIKADKASLKMKAGETKTVALTFLPENAKNKFIMWESSAPGIASVDSFGTITAIKPGTCIISAYSALNKNVKTQIVVTVRDPNAITVTKIELTRTDMTINIGQCDLSAWVTMLPENAPDKTEKWKSSDETVATVDKDGWVYGRKAGECIITVASEDNPDVEAYVKVNVRNPYVQTTAATTAAPAATTVTTARIQQYVEKRDGVTYINGILVANKSYGLPATYAPGMNQTASAAFNDLAAAASKEGLSIRFTSGYRSYKAQEELYNAYVARDGQTAADRYSARPGHSEHQTGLAIDVNSVDKTFIDTPEAKWLEKHAHEFGFIIRYPKGKESITGYQYEPWHIRFVGVQTATKIYESGLCLEEYLGIDSFYQ